MTIPRPVSVSADASPNTYLTGRCPRQRTPIYGTPLADRSPLTGSRDSAGRSVRVGLALCRNVACEVNGRGRDLIARLSAASAAAVEAFVEGKPSAPTLRPQAVYPLVEGASSDYGSDAQLRAEWAQLAAVWGIGGWVNAADDILKRNPAAAPPGAIEAGWRLLDLLEWAGVDSRHPLASQTFRDHP